MQNLILVWVSANGTLPEFAGSGLPHLMPGYTNEPNWWYYCLPYCRQTLESSPDSVLKEKFSAFPSGYSGKATPNAISGSVQKRFLVLDQSWNQTSLIYSSMIGLPIQHLASGTQKLIVVIGCVRKISQLKEI
ncbi:hypothetical protein HHK36_031941 [Tetracentron sinense]|uniref:Uncharacterized protein n=1 Tax=Tetracentron sinense TaxID=13715 RepID=A0A834Y855_TETSI|nr:hypothetical protein HHK36_031941 [Tetracentron sinense]